jgi:hypothetical protein
MASPLLPRNEKPCPPAQVPQRSLEDHAAEPAKRYADTGAVAAFVNRDGHIEHVSRTWFLWADFLTTDRFTARYTGTAMALGPAGASAPSPPFSNRSEENLVGKSAASRSVRLDLKGPANELLGRHRAAVDADAAAGLNLLPCPIRAPPDDDELQRRLEPGAGSRPPVGGLGWVCAGHGQGERAIAA